MKTQGNLVAAVIERLRASGEVDAARAIASAIALREKQESSEEREAGRYLTTTGAGELLGVTGQTIKNWVRQKRLTGYRIGGRILIPRWAVSAYLRAAGASLELEEVTDDEAAGVTDEETAPEVVRSRRTAVAGR